MVAAKFLVRGGCTQPVQMWMLKFSRIWSDNLPSEASEVIGLPIIFTAFCPLRSFSEKNSYFFKTAGYLLRRPGFRVSGFDSGLWFVPGGLADLKLRRSLSSHEVRWCS
ncbi:unnamed protein product [Brassica oleracea]|uniref:(rape) hypothetical protein n=1 Tax=Brassica napus TaxID=3708 RepID=A0A816PXX5_BRANA|nr:unnamed protein product [Brassica napus]